MIYQITLKITEAMKATLASFILISLMITSAARAGSDSVSTTRSDDSSFDAKISLYNGDTLRFLILNPDQDKIAVKVYSDHRIKVLNYDLGTEDAIKVKYVMDNMRKCGYTAVVVRNDKEVARKEFSLK